MTTTHEPFISPNKKWNKYPHNNKNINGFLNTLNYSDAMLGRFMENAKKQNWFDNTIFIFLADHTIGFGDDTRLFKNTKHTIEKKELDNFKIPLLVYAPKLLKSGINNTLSSQTDIIPTLMDSLGWKNNFATLSNSVFDKKVKKRFAIMREGNLLVLSTDDGYIKYNFKDIVEKNQDKLSKKDIEALYQSLSQLLKQNKWMSIK